MVLTNKELMHKLDLIHADVGEIKVEQAKTNGKVKYHDRAIIGIYTALIAIVGWIIYIAASKN